MGFFERNTLIQFPTFWAEFYSVNNFENIFELIIKFILNFPSQKYTKNLKLYFFPIKFQKILGFF